jgi:vacuolar-type H+-ATPase subunit C/Vma6
MQQCNTTDLLEKGTDRGYPSDYLLSRIRGRKARLIRNWTPLVASSAPLEKLPEGHYQRVTHKGPPEGIWRALLDEYRWVYDQMNRGLRNIFSPFFLYVELRTLFVCLRNLKEMKRANSREMLSASLLSDEIKKIFALSPDEFAAARRIEENFQCLSGRFSGISEILNQKGLRGFEHELTARYLSVIILTGLSPVLQTFFMRLIDARNILALARLLKLETTAEEPFMTGGTADEMRLREILHRRSRPDMERLLHELAVEDIVHADPAKLEASLYRRITRTLKKESRADLSIGPILEYLWGCSIEAMNLSILSYGQKLQRDIVAAELIR